MNGGYMALAQLLNKGYGVLQLRDGIVYRYSI